MKSMRKGYIGCLAVLTAAALAGCGQQGREAGQGQQEGHQESRQEGQGRRMTDLISEDDKLIVYTSHKEEVYGPIIREFEERTGIWVQVRAGGTTELLEAIASEEGQQTCDVMFGGGVESYDAYREYFTPYQCSQKAGLDDTYSSEEGYWTVFSELPIVFIYNNKLVNQEEIPVSWHEFLTDKWKGKIAFADPGMSGTSCTALATMLQVLLEEDSEAKAAGAGKNGTESDTKSGERGTEPVMAGIGSREREVLARFAEALDGNLSQGSGQVLDEVASGTRLVGITLEESARKRMALGADISMVYPAEGTSAVPDGSALVKAAPHEENGKLFMNFTVSEDVQKILVSQFYRRSVRKELNLDREESGLKIIDFDLKWASDHQQELLETWNDLTE